MTTNVVALFVVGTPGGLWPAEIAALLRASSLGQRVVLAAPPAAGNASSTPASSLAASASVDSNAASWAGVDAEGCWSSDTLATGFPDARFLLVVEDPALGLADALIGSEPSDPTAWLAGWCAGAQRLLRHFQHDPSRAILIDAADMRRDPAAFAALCTDRFGLTWATPPAPAISSSTDPLAYALAQALANADIRVRAGHDELQASCTVLAADATQALSEHPPVDVAAAGRRLRELRFAAARLEEHAVRDEQDSRRFEALEGELQSLRRVREERDAQALLASGLQTEVLRVHAQHDAVAARARHEEAELRALADAARAELDATRARCVGMERNLQTVSQERQLFALQVSQLHDSLGRQQRVAEAWEAQIARLTESTESLARQAGTSQSELARITEAHASARREWESLRQGLENALRERDAVLTQARRELESSRRELHDLENAIAAGVPSTHRLKLAPDAMAVTAECIVAPFRSLSMSLREVGFDQRRVAGLSVRLVEHHGRPGIAFFDASARELLASWHESGREGERPYLLLVPGDQNSQPAFDVMGGTDWLLLQALVGEIGRRLQRPRGDVSAAAFWAHSSQRLAERLQELPTCVRYDECSVESPRELPASRLTLRFTRVEWSSRRLAALTVHWRASGPEAGIEIEAQPVGPQALSAWPFGADGALSDRVTVPLGRGADEGAKRTAWGALPARDRNFLFDLLAAWPGAVARLPRHMVTDEWLAAAADMLPDARRAAGDTGAAPRRGLARVAHSLRHGSAAAAA